MSADEDWVQAAMSDDALVVDLLVRLHHAPPQPFRKPASLPLEWTVRQRRSKPVSLNNNPKKPAAHRASPTTPLSWRSGATSVSGGSEESSHPTAFKLSNTTRSKVSTLTEKVVFKKSRKKKSLAQLKDEETSLLKERRDLKREMAALRVNLERQMATNENLKRMKIELRPCLDRVTKTLPEDSISDQIQQPFIAPIRPITPLISCNDFTPQPTTLNGSDESKFILPDLNMPFDDEP